MKPKAAELKTKVLFLAAIIIVATFVYLYTLPSVPMLSVDRVYNVVQPGSSVLMNMSLNNVQSCGGWFVELAWDPTTVKLAPGGVPRFGK